MTIALAVRGDNGYHLATDAQISRGSSVEYMSVPKLISAGHAKILYCGTVSLCQELTENTNGDDAELVAIQLAVAVRKRMGRKRTPLDVDFLVCDGRKLFSVAGDKAVLPVSGRWAAIGEEDMAVGAMWAAQRADRSPLLMAYAGVEACIHNTTTCGGEVQYVFLPAQ